MISIANQKRVQGATRHLFSRLVTPVIQSAALVVAAGSSALAHPGHVHFGYEHNLSGIGPSGIGPSGIGIAEHSGWLNIIQLAMPNNLVESLLLAGTAVVFLCWCLLRKWRIPIEKSQ